MPKMAWAEITPTKPSSGDGSSATPYQISTAGELYWFASLVNGTLTDGTAQNTSANAVLVNDITVNTGVLTADGTFASDVSGFSEWTPIGNSSNQYKGTFNGQSYTVSGLYFNNSTTDHVGLFGFISKGGKISNVGVVDSYFKGDEYISGVCGYNNYGTIGNCFHIGSVSGEWYIGGVCGRNYYGEISNWYSAGAVSGSNYVGGVCAYNYSGTILNCYFDSEKCDKDAVGTNNSGTVTNTAGKTTAQFASGEVCYLLNGSKSDGTQAWYQDLTAETGDQLPILKATGENTVYQVKKYSGCEHDAGTSVEYYSNQNKDVYAGYSSAGFCSHGSYQKAVFNSTDNAYEISNVGQLLWFAGLVNGTLTDGTSQNRAANAKVMCDIDFGTTNFAAIGKSQDILYAGTFDGNGHTIKVNQTGSEDVALFGNIGACTIKNLTVTGTINTSVKYAAGIAMHKYGDGTTATIENCISDVTIVSTVSGDGTHGGIIAVVDYGTLNINNCAFTGAINGSTTNKCGGFIGYTNKTSNISNSYVSATFGISSAGCNIVSRKGGTVTVTNCYYLNELGNYMDGITKMTTTQFANGEVCYLLNAGKTDGTQAWHQNLASEGGDKYPVLKTTDGNTVYGANIECAGVTVGTICANSPVTGEVYDTHDMDGNGFCSRGCYEEAQPVLYEALNNNTATFADNEKMLEVLGQFKELSDAGYFGEDWIGTDSTNMVNEFGDRNCAMALANSSFIKQIKEETGTEDEFGLFLEPLGDNTYFPASPAGPTMFGYNGSEHPELVKEFFNFVTTTESLQEILDNSPAFTNIHANDDAVEQHWLPEEEEFMASIPEEKMSISVLQNGTKYTNDYWMNFGQDMVSYCLGEMEANDVLKNMDTNRAEAAKTAGDEAWN